MSGSEKSASKFRKFFRNREHIKVLVAVTMLLIGISCVLYPVIAKRYNEHIALKANQRYAEEQRVHYDEDGDVVLIP